jgi:hypothetical protein
MPGRSPRDQVSADLPHPGFCDITGAPMAMTITSKTMPGGMPAARVDTSGVVQRDVPVGRCSNE